MFVQFTFFRLAEVGKLSAPKVHEKYETGQFFLHRVFAYRGVILFPWRAKIYDRNTYTASPTNSDEIDSTTTTETTKDETATKSGAQSTTSRKIETTEADSTRNDGGKKEVSVDIQTYYQVLIDSRDCPHIVSSRILSLEINF